MCQICSCSITALEKIQQGLVGRGSTAHVIVAQEEFAHLGAVERRRRTKRGGFEPSWGRRGVGVESRRRETVIAGPEPTTDLFVRVGFPRDAIRAWALRYSPT